MSDLTFGDRELDVMSVLWERGSASVAEVRERLPDPLAYTTVLTVLRNLEAKGYVRHEEEGKAHRYFPVVERQEATRSAIGRVIDKLFGGSPEMLLAHLVDDHALDADEVRRLQRRLKRRLESRDGDRP